MKDPIVIAWAGLRKGGYLVDPDDYYAAREKGFKDFEAEKAWIKKNAKGRREEV